MAFSQRPARLAQRSETGPENRHLPKPKILSFQYLGVDDGDISARMTRDGRASRHVQVSVYNIRLYV
jgi:hypothetical protein